WTAFLFSSDLAADMSEPSQIDSRSEYIHHAEDSAAKGKLDSGAEIRIFVSGSCGARGISSGITSLDAGAQLPYHRHQFSEAVVILEGQAQFAVEGRHYFLSPLDTIHVPAGVAHCVTNSSNDSRLIAYFAFATDVPSRELVADCFVRQNRDWTNPEPQSP